MLYPALEEPEQADIQSDRQSTSAASSEWFPYPTKMVSFSPTGASILFDPCLDVSLGYSGQSAQVASLEFPHAGVSLDLEGSTVQGCTFL